MRYILFLLCALPFTVTAQDGTKNIVTKGDKFYKGGTYLSGDNQTGVVDFKANGETGFTFYDASLKTDIFAIDATNGFRGFLSISPTFNWMRTSGNTKIDDEISGSSIDIESTTGSIGLFNGVTNMGVTVGSEVIVTGTTTGGMQYNVPQTSFEPKSMVTKQYVDDRTPNTERYFTFNILDLDENLTSDDNVYVDKGFIYIPSIPNARLKKVIYRVGDASHDANFTLRLYKIQSPIDIQLNSSSAVFSVGENEEVIDYPSTSTISGMYKVRTGIASFTTPPSGLIVTIVLEIIN